MGNIDSEQMGKNYPGGEGLNKGTETVKATTDNIFVLFLLHTHPPKLCTVTFLPHWLDWAESRGRESVAFKLLLRPPILT